MICAAEYPAHVPVSRSSIKRLFMAVAVHSLDRANMLQAQAVELIRDMIPKVVDSSISACLLLM